MSLPEGDPRHGTNGYSNLDCRCDICRTAQSAYHARTYSKVEIGGIQVDFRRADADKVRAYAASKGRSIRQIAIQAIDEYMERNP